MKKLFRFLILLLLVLLAGFFWQVYQNNQNAQLPQKSEIDSRLGKAISWLENNYSKIENRSNPILWWMIKQAAENTDNSRLQKIYKTYKKNHLDRQAKNLSSPMFYEYYRPRMPDISEFRGLDDYQVLFFYATSCDKELGSEARIQKQLNPDFCSLHFLQPRCVTHQLMGLRFMQRYQCGYDDKVNAGIQSLQDKIVSELTWDFRVADAYLQRITMLVDSGAFNRIKPVWLKRILDAQNSDGSWDDIDPIFYISDNKAIAFTSMLPAIKTIKPSFHATAQGIWLLSMLSTQAEIQ